MNEISLKNQESSKTERLPDHWIDAIFKEFHGRFGNAFLSKWATGHIDRNGADQGIENAKQVWAKNLAGLSADEIKRGIDADYQYPPDCDKFKLVCKPTITSEAAFYEAVKQMWLREEGKDKWSSPIIYWSAVRLGNDLNKYPYQAIKNRWESIINSVTEEIKNGGLPDHVPVKMIELPQPGKCSIPQDEAKKRINLLKKQFFECTK